MLTNQFNVSAMFKTLTAGLFMVVNTSCGGDDPAPGSNGNAEGADLVLRNGAIYTVNETQPWAEAVAIEDGLIVFVGSNEGVEGFIGKIPQ